MDTDAVLDLIRTVADQVVVPRFRDLGEGDIHEKKPGDLVTVADREAEGLITRALLQDDPGVLVVGEEATAADPGLLDQLAASDHAWVVDPVDGTRNFVHGRPDYAMMIGELRGGECVRGWIWQPEHGRAYVAERSAGLRCNGEPVTRSAPTRDPKQLRVLTSRPAQEGRHGPVRARPSAWCCGIDYPWLASGVADALCYARSMPWDHAAGSLFVRETGGVVRHLDGTDYRPGQSRTEQHHAGQLLAAADEQAWRTVAAAITGDVE